MTKAPDSASEPLVTAKNVDLTNCDREQIHIPGAIQPHGAMLVLDEPTLRIQQASANCREFTGHSVEELVAKPVGEAIGPENETRLRELFVNGRLDNDPYHLRRERLHERECNIFAHRSGGVVLVEIERVPPHAIPPLLDVYSDLRNTIARLQATTSLQAFFDLAVEQIRLFTGYDVVLAYKFLEDGSGHVMAESKLPHIQSYLGQHYPPTDIPAPARRLFALSWLRHLPDVNYTPSPLLPELRADQPPVDMSQALLRSVSVMYSGYLRNMGVKSTTVMPLMKDGALWGLISAMHHSGPLHVGFEARMAAEFLAHMISLLMSAKEDAEIYQYRLRIAATLDRLLQDLAISPSLNKTLTRRDGRPNLLSFIEADGAAVVTESEGASSVGLAPDAQQLLELVSWLSQQSEPLFVTDRLSNRFPPAAAYRESASGLIAVRLSPLRRDYLLWFRPELIQIVNWAGDPNKPVEVDESTGELRLGPRKSFALWQETAHGRSKPWNDAETQGADDLRRSIMELIVQRAAELERVNKELTKSNVELDSFAYVASHDLKEPLRGIYNFSTFLERSSRDRLNETERQQLQTIMKLTRRMDDLIESLLHYSRVGRTELALRDCNLDTVLDEALLALKARIDEAGVSVRRPQPLPNAVCDPVRMRDVFVNLIANAIKYNDKTEPWVEVGWEAQARPVFYVRDNGIGIAEENYEQIFKIFRRLHGRDEFGGGTGAGLTIARKTIERHGGRLWVESKPGVGSTFWFTLHGEEA